jgi:hypothetical protein
MLELYFIFYRIPKLMTRLARERNRNAVGWSLLGVATWIAAEVIVVFGAGMIYGIGILLFDWPEPIPSGVKLVVYILALATAIFSITMLSRVLVKPPKQKWFPSPPPPPDFQNQNQA